MSRQTEAGPTPAQRATSALARIDGLLTRQRPWEALPLLEAFERDHAAALRATEQERRSRVRRDITQRPLLRLRLAQPPSRTWRGAPSGSCSSTRPWRRSGAPPMRTGAG